MDNNSVYTLTKSADSIIPKGINNIDEWIESLHSDELSEIYRKCAKRPDERSGEEDYEICRHSIVLYCREFGLTELGINSEFVAKITGNFCMIVICEALKRQDIVEFDRPASIYSGCDIKVVEKKKGDEN